jgi:uncharacterized damage-inducible protein DinB
MPKFKSEDLLNELQEDVRKLIAAVEFIKLQDKVKLAYPLQEGKWTAVQCLEHLNIYSRYYLSAIDTAMAADTDAKDAWFNTGKLGNYFTNMMKPGNVYEINNKMKTPKGYAPPIALSVDTVINEYLEQKQKLLLLLETAKGRNLNTIRIPVSITKMVKMKLGDTFRFLIAHEQRHLIQARNALHALGIATDKFPVILQVVPQ